MSTVASAPLENGFCNGGDDGGTCAKRIKLAPTHQPSAEENIAKLPASATNGVHERRKGATARPAEKAKVAENGHLEEKDEKAPAAAGGPVVAVRRNQDGEISDGYVSTEDWKTKWESGKTRFHKTQVHGMLKKYFHRLTEGKKSPRFLVPLCGKSVDMVWLSEKGCSVVGCEVVELGVQQFFTDNKIEYTKESLEGIDGCVYKGKDKNISIYCANFFDLSSALIGQFDCVWDRGSMAAINPGDRKRYRDVITDVLKPGSRYLLDVFEVPHDVFSGPPHCVKPEEVKQLFGATCDIEHLEHINAMNPWSESWGVTYFYENDFILTAKK